MKKLICLLVAFVLSFSSASLAESVPSKKTDDLISFEIESPLGYDFFIRPVYEHEEDDQEKYQNRIDICRVEVEKLIASEDINTYLGTIVDSEGNEVVLGEFFENDEALNIFEFCAIIAGGYHEEYGDVSVRMLFPTPYEKDENVVVMLGIVTLHEDGTQTVEWTAYDGIGLDMTSEELQGCIRVELNSEIVLEVQKGIALMAVVSQ